MAESFYVALSIFSVDHISTFTADYCRLIGLNPTTMLLGDISILAVLPL